MYYDPLFRLTRNIAGVAVPASLPAITVGEGQEFPTLSAAYAEHGDNYPYYIVGEITDSPTIAAEILVYGGPGARITGTVTFAGNTNFVKIFNVEIFGTVVLSGVTIPAAVSFYDCYIYNVVGIAVEMIVSSQNANLGLYGETVVRSQGFVNGHAISITGAGGGEGLISAHPSALIDGSVIGASYGVYIEDDAGSSLLDSDTLLRGCMIQGNTNAIFSTAAVNVAAYGCILKNGVNANVTLPAGGNNIII